MWSRVIRLAPVALLAMFLTGCDWFVAYTVVNETDRPATAWILFESCDTAIGQKGEYGYKRTVPPGETVQVDDVTGPLDPEPWCLQVVDEQRRLLLAEPYDYARVYVVTNDPQPGVIVPGENDLPGESLGEQLGEIGPVFLVLYGVGFLFGLGVVAALLFAAFVTIRFFYRFYRGRT